MRFVVGVVAVLGRILLCAVFLAVTLGYMAPDVNTLAQTIALKITLAPVWVLRGAMVLLVLGSLSVIIGYKARFGAFILLAFMMLTTYPLFHGFTFWNVVNSQVRHDHIIFLAMNLSILGAMLLVVVNGPGQMSLDKGR